MHMLAEQVQSIYSSYSCIKENYLLGMTSYIVPDFMRARMLRVANDWL